MPESPRPASGLATSDSFAGLRALLTPADKRPSFDGQRRRRRRRTGVYGMETAGRWTRLGGEGGPGGGLEGGPAVRPEERVTARGAVLAPETLDTIARSLLRRYGVVFRRLLEREGTLPPWRDLLRVYRRLEARGEIRGGRFVAGFAGEQFALPEAIGKLRAARRDGSRGELVLVSGADPTNLLGILLPGARVPAHTANRVLYRDGEPIAVRGGGEVRFLAQLDRDEELAARRVLDRRRVAPRLRAYLGTGA